MTSITLTPEIMGIIANILLVVGGFIKLESRLTKLETTQHLMLNGMIDTGEIERRKNSSTKNPT